MHVQLYLVVLHTASFSAKCVYVWSFVASSLSTIERSCLSSVHYLSGRYWDRDWNESLKTYVSIHVHVHCQCDLLVGHSMETHSTQLCKGFSKHTKCPSSLHPKNVIYTMCVGSLRQRPSIYIFLCPVPPVTHTHNWMCIYMYVWGTCNIQVYMHGVWSLSDL